MSYKTSSAKATTGLIESNLEIKSFIHQQILDFEPYITPETLIIVIARDPDQADEEDDVTDEQKGAQHRIAIVLKEDDSSIEAEAFHDDIFEAIKQAKEKLVLQLIEIQNEVEGSQDRLNAIQQASSQVH